MKPPFGFNQKTLKDIEEISKHMRMIEQLGGTAAVDAIYRFSRDIAAYERNWRDIAKIGRHALETEAVIRQLARPAAWMRIEDSYRGLIESFRFAIPQPQLNFAVLTTSTGAVLSALNDAKLVHSELSPLWEYIPKADQALDEEEIKGDLKAINDYVVGLLDKIPKPDFWTVATFVISLLVAAYFQYGNTVDLARVEDKIDTNAIIAQSQNEALKRIEKRLDTLIAEQEEVAERLIYFVARTRLKVRQTRKPDSATVGILRDGQFVSLVKDCGHRLKIQYLDLSTQTLKQGWVLKKWMKRVPSLPPVTKTVPQERSAAQK